MHDYSKTYEIRWADMDPNRHMRHSVYLDYAAQTRVGMFADYGLSLDEISETGLGPILFREEIKYRHEVRMLDELTVCCSVQWMYRDSSRWSFSHPMFRADGTSVAELTVDGAWLDLEARKLGSPSENLLNVMKQFPRAADFEWVDRNKSS